MTETNSDKEFLRSVIDFFGKDKQAVVAIEEMAELTQQLSKFVIRHKKRDRRKVVEEFVDVLIMLDQIQIIFNISEYEIETGRKLKIQRLRDYIATYSDDKSPEEKHTEKFWAWMDGWLSGAIEVPNEDGK